MKRQLLILSFILLVIFTNSCRNETDFEVVQVPIKDLHFTVSPFLSPVGVRRFERPTTRPPDAYSNRAELHPALFKPAKLIQNFKSCNHIFLQT